MALAQVRDACCEAGRVREAIEAHVRPEYVRHLKAAVGECVGSLVRRAGA